MNLGPGGGIGQCVKLKSSLTCEALTGVEQFKIEDIKFVNPGNGKVQVHSTVGIGLFYGGRFSFQEFPGASARSTSSRQSKPILAVRLYGGDFKSCKATRSLSGVTVKKPVRRLWGKGKGRFRTRGRYSSGTVRGTNWLTEDFCDGTRTRVVAGVVQVYDLVTKKWIILKPGQSYFAKAGKIK